jgi:hypothetical protein
VPLSVDCLAALAAARLCDRVLAGLVGGLAATVALGYVLAMVGWSAHF